MSRWRKEVMNKFTNQPYSLFLVNDPDLLLDDEVILQQLQDQHFEIVRFEDSILLRYLFETELVKKMENSCKIILVTNDYSKAVFPFDFLQKGLSIEISIRELFPKFSAPIVRLIDKEDFDALYTVHSQYQGSSSNQETTEFVVNQVYKLAYKLIESEPDFYKMLLEIHYDKKELPLVIQQFLIEKIVNKPLLKNLPVKDMLISKSYFYRYVEEQWKLLLNDLSQIQNGVILEEMALYHTHPLTNSDVRRLMNDLFTEGFLQKGNFNSSLKLPKWMESGIEKNEQEVDNKKCEHLNKKIVENLSSASRYKDWIKLMGLVGEYSHIVHSSKDEVENKRLNSLLNEVNQLFEVWMLQKYKTLPSLPPSPLPKMVHHIPHFISSKRKQEEKVALLVMDGMGFAQWKKIKHYLVDRGLSFEENGVFAWVPTLTSVSRQAIFSGSSPSVFSNYLHTTSKEEKYWKMFWENQGTLKQYVSFQKGLGKQTYNKSDIFAFNRPNIKIYGAVIDIIDKIMHGAIQGEKSLMSELDLWLNSNYLHQLLSDLQRENFTVYLTADHGNTESIGNGRLSEGVLVEQKGERVRIYSDQTLLNAAKEKLESISWNNIGLPDDYHVLLSKYGQAFVNKGDRVVSHGGISIEEVIVPIVKVIAAEVDHS